MKSLRTISIALLPIAFVLGILGYAFEASYFFALGLNVHKYFGLHQFVISGFLVVLPMFVVLFIYTQLKKFFTKQVHEDDAKTVSEQLAKTTFANQLIGARMAVAFSLVYWIVVVFAPKFGVDWPLWPVFGYMSFVNLLFFYGTILLSPSQSRLAILVAFLVSVSLCFSAGGYGQAIDKRRIDPVIRDDFLVRIMRTATDQTVETKPVRLPLPILQQLIDKII